MSSSSTKRRRVGVVFGDEVAVAGGGAGGRLAVGVDGPHAPGRPATRRGIPAREARPGVPGQQDRPGRQVVSRLLEQPLARPRRRIEAAVDGAVRSALVTRSGWPASCRCPTVPRTRSGTTPARSRRALVALAWTNSHVSNRQEAPCRCLDGLLLGIGQVAARASERRVFQPGASEAIGRSSTAGEGTYPDPNDPSAGGALRIRRGPGAMRAGPARER